MYNAMENLLSTGKVRAIDVSNFNINRPEDLLANVDIDASRESDRGSPVLTTI
jgi:diketogulonate reductase-like aldo/keto reductase